MQAEAAEWSQKHEAEAIAIGSKIHGISEADGKKLYDWSGMASVLTAEDLAAMENDVAFLLGQAMIQNGVEVEDFVLDAAFKAR